MYNYFQNGTNVRFEAGVGVCACVCVCFGWKHVLIHVTHSDRIVDYGILQESHHHDSGFVVSLETIPMGTSRTNPLLYWLLPLATPTGLRLAAREAAPFAATCNF